MKKVLKKKLISNEWNISTSQDSKALQPYAWEMKEMKKAYSVFSQLKFTLEPSK